MTAITGMLVGYLCSMDLTWQLLFWSCCYSFSLLFHPQRIICPLFHSFSGDAGWSSAWKVEIERTKQKNGGHAFKFLSCLFVGLADRILLWFVFIIVIVGHVACGMEPKSLLGEDGFVGRKLIFKFQKKTK